MILEKIDDWFVNLYKKWIFTRCFEYSAVLVWKITGYKIYANIDKKTWFIFLELGFPKIKEKEILQKLENNWNFLRIIENKQDIEEIIWDKKLERDEDKLRKIKQNLINF